MPSQWEDKKKPHRNIVFVGHVDHGKSTTVGRLLLDSGHIEGHVIEKNEKLAAEQGKAGFGLAYVMDGLKEERERGITIDVAHKEFFTPKYYWTVIDAPGHRDFVKNMITGASQADTAVLLCAANDGVNAQTKEHAFLARVLGVKELIVHVNKMDISGVDWAEEKYNATKTEVSNLLKMAGFGGQLDRIPFIPASSLNGDNVYEKSDKCPWYNGPTLFEAIDAVLAAGIGAGRADCLNRCIHAARSVRHQISEPVVQLLKLQLLLVQVVFRCAHPSKTGQKRDSGPRLARARPDRDERFRIDHHDHTLRPL